MFDVDINYISWSVFSWFYVLHCCQMFGLLDICRQQRLIKNVVKENEIQVAARLCNRNYCILVQTNKNPMCAIYSTEIKPLECFTTVWNTFFKNKNKKNIVSVLGTHKHTHVWWKRAVINTWHWHVSNASVWSVWVWLHLLTDTPSISVRTREKKSHFSHFLSLCLSLSIAISVHGVCHFLQSSTDNIWGILNIRLCLE